MSTLVARSYMQELGHRREADVRPGCPLDKLTDLLPIAGRKYLGEQRPLWDTRPYSTNVNFDGRVRLLSRSLRVRLLT
jgi:hypothetical protein